MGKLIVIGSKNCLTVKAVVIPFLTNYYAQNDAVFEKSNGDLTLVAYLSEKPMLVEQLKNITNAKNVIIDIVHNAIPPQMPITMEPMEAAKHISDQIQELAKYKWPFNVIIHGKYLPERAKFIADMFIDDTSGSFEVLRESKTFFKAYMGNELTYAAKENIMYPFRIMDIDGDVSRGKFYDISTGTYPTGTHPYAIAFNTQKYVHIPEPGKYISEADILAVQAGDEDVYCQLVDEHMRLETASALESYANVPPTVTIDKNLNFISKEPLEVNDIIEGIANLDADGVYAMDEAFHPYTLGLIAGNMRDQQRLFIAGKEYSSYALQLLLLHSPHFYNQQLEAFLKQMAPYTHELWTVGYH